ncbi:hypothetical protein LCGC14_2944270, partial [marine sediment metagenome]
MDLLAKALKKKPKATIELGEGRSEDSVKIIEESKLDEDISKITDDIEKVLKNLPAKRNFSDEFSWKKIFKRYE